MQNGARELMVKQIKIIKENYKMKNFITSYLLNGELEHKLTQIPEEHKPAIEIVIAAGDELEKTLSDEQKILFLKYYDLLMSYRDNTSEYHFTEGFK